MEVKLVKLTFKPGKKKIWLDWCEELKRRQKEVIATLKNEGVVSESCFISKDGKSVFYYMEADDLEKAKNAVNKKSFQIDKEHKKARESSLLKIESLTPLFNFQNR